MEDLTFLVFNFSSPVIADDFFSECDAPVLRWSSGHRLEECKYEDTHSLEVSSGYGPEDFDNCCRLTRSDDCEYWRRTSESVIIKSYEDLGVRFGEIVRHKPELVRDMVIALRDGEDIDAVIVRHLGEMNIGTEHLNCTE